MVVRSPGFEKQQPLEQNAGILVKERLWEVCILIWESVRQEALGEEARYFKQFHADCTISDDRRRSKITSSCLGSQTPKQRSQSGLAFSHGWRSLLPWSPRLLFPLIHSMNDALMDTKTQSDILLGTKTGLPFCYREDDVTLWYRIFQGSKQRGFLNVITTKTIND